jgi:hypothetical protein
MVEKSNPDSCDHRFVLLDSRLKTVSSAAYQIHWMRTDTFFCERCLEQREVVKDEYSRDAPKWW